jgi:energy-coupling factor transporter transmembrane protein EcfT
MLFFIIIFVLYVIPLIFAIWCISVISRGFGHEKFSKRFKKISFTILGVLFIGANVYNYLQNHYSYSIAVNDKTVIHIKMERIDDFMDVPVHMEFEIENRNKPKDLEFTMGSHRGPELEIYSYKYNN